MRIADLFKIALKVAFAVGLVVWLVGKGMLDLDELWQTAKWYHLVIGVCICLFMLAIVATRFLILVRQQGVKISFIQSFRLTLIGQFFNYAIPGGVSGDVVKGYYLVKASGGAKTNALVSILIDRFIGFWAMSFMASVALFFKWPMVMANQKTAAMGISICFYFCYSALSSA